MGSKLTDLNVRWSFDLARWRPSYSDILYATRCVQQEEKDRLMRFVYKDDFKASLIGRLMMRKYLAEATGRQYDEIKVLRDDKGKPFSECSVNFNVSHQGDWTVLAGSSNLVGVDVVKLERPAAKSLAEYFRIMERTFSADEWLTIKTDRHPLRMFCRHWCLKESYVKAVGVGITINLQDVSFNVKSKTLSKEIIVDDSEVEVEGRKLPQWRFQEQLLDNDHCVAVATLTRDGAVFKEIDFTELMAGAVPLLEIDEGYCRRFFEKDEKS